MTTLSTTPSLPQETLEEIIDFLYDDREALFSCSLASSKFVPVSRHHLFSQVTLLSTKLCRFLELLDKPWNSFSNMISKIIVTGNDHFSSRRMQKRCAGRACLKAQYIPENFSRLRERLQSVSSVRLTDLSSVDIPESFWCLLFEMKGVKAMEANRIAFDGCPLPFFGYISSFPLLETLSVSRPTMAMTAAHLASLQEHIGGGEHKNVQLPRRGVGTKFRVPLLDIRRSLQIPNQNRDLSTSTIAGIAIFEWLLIQRPVPSVDLLKMNVDVEPGMVTMLTRYFEIAGWSIENLCVVLPSSIAILQDMLDIDFSPISRLRSLHIDGLFMSHTTSPRVLEDFFCGFFAQLFSSSKASSGMTIEKIIITLTIDGKSDYSFYGMPDYAVLQPFTWCFLPSIIEKSLEPFSEKLKAVEMQLRVRSSGIEGKQAAFAEQSVRTGVWKRFNDSGCLRVVFLPVQQKDEDANWV